MNVVLISRCSQNALRETRRIIDQFAMRIGDSAWQTAITEAGLDTLRKNLRKTARKNTAVACRRITRNASELLWIVGNRSSFNDQGFSPTNTTRADILRTDDENSWNTLEIIRILCGLAALFHDMGKATDHFQNRLCNAVTPIKNFPHIRDPYRHEWISVRILQAFTRNRTDEDWLRDLAQGRFSLLSLPNEIFRDGLDTPPLPIDTTRPSAQPFKDTPPLARAVGWLILSHHKLPLCKWRTDKLSKKLPEHIGPGWKSLGTMEYEGLDKESLWTFRGDPTRAGEWKKLAERLALRALGRIKDFARPLDNVFALHTARMALIMADHYYSGLSDPKDRTVLKNDPLHANTTRDAQGNCVFNQGLAEHLVKVADFSSLFLHQLPNLRRRLPGIARHRLFTRRNTEQRFRWQDKCFDKATSIAAASREQGGFFVNMASTGCGKTLANGRIMYALGDQEQGVRFTYALGLRTLTLQTGREYREMLGLGEEDLAVLVGGGELKTLFLHQQEQSEELADGVASGGLEDGSSFFFEGNSVHYEGSVDSTPLGRWFSKARDAEKILDAPITVCTIDHLMPATEALRGGRHIPPVLRLMTSDVILDEPDDFSLGDLYGLTRLVHWAGMYGSRVLLSSATLPPSLCQGLYAAYAAGRALFRQNCGDGRATPIWCGWFDEFNAEAHEVTDEGQFAQRHADFAAKRSGRIASGPQRKLGVIVPVEEVPSGDPHERVAATIVRHAQELHALHHAVDSRTGARVSFGLARMANINPLVNTTKRLMAMEPEENTRIHICCYHSQFQLLARSAIEQRLDALLTRKGEDASDPPRIFENASVRNALDNQAAENHLFLVCATAVAEVGRDHDYDWAIIEPSSMRSIVQLAGRILRHRHGRQVEAGNIRILAENIQALKGERVCFSRPGFETKDRHDEKSVLLKEHNLEKVLGPEQVETINSLPRINEPDLRDFQDDLVALEHFQTHAAMFGHGGIKRDGACRWWDARGHLAADWQIKHRFRDGKKRQRFVAELDDDGPDLAMIRIEDDGTRKPCDQVFQEQDVPQGRSIQFMQGLSYPEAAQELADSMDMTLSECTKRFGTFDLRDKERWQYNPNLGFYSDQ